VQVHPEPPPGHSAHLTTNHKASGSFASSLGFVYDLMNPEASLVLRYAKASSDLTWAPSASRVLFSSGRNPWILTL
jgi:hypothetical protein